METKDKNGQSLVKIPEKEFLSLVVEKLKDRDLFPQKTEDAKDYLKKITKAQS